MARRRPRAGPALPPSSSSCARPPSHINDLARLIALRGYDPALVEDDCFRSFVGRLNPEFKLPSREAVEEICDVIFNEAREDLLYRIRRSNGKVSLAVGKTKTMYGEVLYTTCHFIDDNWKLHKVVHDAYLISPISIFYGPLLGVPEATLTNEHTTEADESSKRAAKDIWDSLLETDGDIVERTFVVVWGIEDLQMISSMEKIVTASALCLDSVLGRIALWLSFGVPFTVNIYKKVHGLDMTREKRQRLFSHMGLDHLLAQDNCWYSCYCSLEFLRQHGSCTIEDKDYSQLIELMCRIWGVIYRAIQTVSTSTCPTSNQYLVELFKVREILQSELERIGVGADDDSIVYPGHSDVFIEEADNVADIITKAKNNLDETMENFYLQWSAPLVVDPRYKLDYIKSTFRKAFGSEGTRKVSTVRKYISKLYADYIEYDSGINSEDSESDGDNSGDGMSVAGSYLDPGKELDLYLNDPRVVEATQDFDILNWWKVNSSKYPTVARMARDVLAMPTCSKLSSEQMAHVNSIVRGYSKKKYRQAKYEP